MLNTASAHVSTPIELPTVRAGLVFGVPPAPPEALDLATLDNPETEAATEPGSRTRGTRRHPRDHNFTDPTVARYARHEPRWLIALDVLPQNGQDVAGMWLPHGQCFARVYRRDLMDLVAATMDRELHEAIEAAKRTFEMRIAAFAAEHCAEKDEQTGQRVVTARSMREARARAPWSVQTITGEHRPDLARKLARTSIGWLAILEECDPPRTAASEQRATFETLAAAIRDGQRETAQLLAAALADRKGK